MSIDQLSFVFEDEKMWAEIIVPSADIPFSPSHKFDLQVRLYLALFVFKILLYLARQKHTILPLLLVHMLQLLAGSSVGRG